MIRSGRRRGLVILLLLGLSCSAKRLEPVVARPIDELAFTEVDGGLLLAIDPLLDARANQAQYGVDFLDEGILAVRVVARNGDPAASYALLPQNVTLGAPGEDAEPTLAEDPTSAAPAVATYAAGYAMMAASVASVVTAPLIVPALPLMLWSNKMAADVLVIRHRLLVESLYPTTLSPGEGMSGLVLLSHPEESRDAPREVCIGYLNLGESEVAEACFPLAAGPATP